MASPLNQPSPQTNGATNIVFNTKARLDFSYLFTHSGIMKAAVVLLNILGFICIMSSSFRSNGRGVYFSLVAHAGLWFSGIMLLLYLYHLVERHHNIPWLKIELIVYVVLTFSNLIASTIAVAFGSAAYSAAGFFGYLAMVVYGIDAFLAARALKAGKVAQGQKVVNKPTHLVTPPALP